MGSNHGSFLWASFSFLLLLLSLLLSSVPSLSLSNPISQPQPNASLQVFHVKKQRTHTSVNGLVTNGKKRRKRRRKRGSHFGAATFAPMLPRGLVPPSDSSWCHNDAPKYSIDFFCRDYSALKP